MNTSSPAYWLTVKVIVAFIFLSVATVIFETVNDVYLPYKPFLDALEVVILAAFTAEYAANIYAADDRRRYITSFWGVVDLLAIVPGFMSLLHLLDIKALRTLRVLRVLRVLKLMKLATTRARESAAMVEARRNTFVLDIQIYFITLFTVVIVSSTLAFYTEGDVKGTTFTSIPAAMWWAIVTITTTGYGDMVPQTVWGKFVATGTMLSGLALFGILTSVIGRGVLTSLFGRGDSAAESPAAPPDVDGGTPVEGVAMAPVAGGRTTALAAAVSSATTAGAGRPSFAVQVPASHRAHPANAFLPGSAPIRRQSSTAYMRSAVQVRQIHQHPSMLYRLIYAAFADQTSRLYHIVSTIVIGLVFFSVGLVVLESVESLSEQYYTFFQVADVFVVAAFTLEYVANLTIARNKREYIFSFWGMVDLLAVAPSYLILFNFTAVKVVRTLRILRVLRILKLSKQATQAARLSVKQRNNTFLLDLQIYLVALLTAVIISSALAFYAERGVPDSAYSSIPAAMWWAVVTITTTGYGDMAPVTLAGRVVAGATMLTGLALFGILTSVIGRAMMSSLFGTGDAEER